MLVGDVFRPFVDVFVRSDVPCFFKDKLIHERVAVESLECGADTAEVLSSVELTTQEGATADSYAGGLIGRYDAQNSTLKNCGAAVTVSGSASYAGGLVGGITNINTVQNCYAAGKTYESHYEDQDGNPIYNVTGVKAAGGLIGYAEGLNNTKNNYSTASVKATGSNGYAGGLIGQSNNADLTECYATGLVYAQDPNHAGLIAGTITGGNWENISYLPKINVADMPAVPGKNNTVTALTAEEAADSITYRYDKTLPETYPYPMYATAGSSDGKKSHYGDWPKPIPPKSLDAEVTNDEVLYTDLAPKKTGAELPSAITVLVGGETSGNYEQFVIKLNSGKNSVASISRTGWKSRQVNSSDNNQKLQDQSFREADPDFTASEHTDDGIFEKRDADRHPVQHARLFRERIEFLEKTVLAD